MPRVTKVKPVVNENTKEHAVAESAMADQAVADNTVKAYKVKKNLPPNLIVTVRNGFNGMLIYESPRTHETFVWEEFGSEQDMELQELKNARNAYRSFFENNWFLISDPEVIENLGVSNYYKDALTFENFDSMFTLTPEEIIGRVKLLSDGQKITLRYRAKQLISEGGIDSIKVINALEKALGIELIER